LKGLGILLDISRYVVGWLLARKEAAALAKVLIAESCEPVNGLRKALHSGHARKSGVVVACRTLAARPIDPLAAAESRPGAAGTSSAPRV